MSNYYTPTTFGILGHYEMTTKPGQYIEQGTPGTGFFVRNTSSHSYRSFVRGVKDANKKNYLRLLTGTQFSFRKEIKRAREAQQSTTSNDKKKILESYINMLEMASEMEWLERVIQALKDASHRHSTSRFRSNILNSYKTRQARLMHDCRGVQLHVLDTCTREQYDKFIPVAEAFAKACSSHRIWHMFTGDDAGGSASVFFDMGIFNYVQQPATTPMMRDGYGVCYFLYPNMIIRARTAVDFDIIPMTEVSFVFREIPYDKVLETMSDSQVTSQRHRHYDSYHPDYDAMEGDLLASSGHHTNQSEKVRIRVVGEMYIPELDLRFCSQDVQSLRAFVDAMNHYRGELGVES